MNRLLVLALSFSTVSVTAFMVAPDVSSRQSTHLFLEDHVADMIDQQLYRQQHKLDLERSFQEKNSEVLEQQVAIAAAVFDENEYEMGFQQAPRQHKKDVLLAETDPQTYCADRCISTGNCEVFEEFFDLSPEEVVKFCTDCVISDDEETCDIPNWKNMSP